MTKASAAKLEYIAAYDRATYERMTIRFPRGTKARITAQGVTVNGIINRLLSEWLTAQEGKQPAQDTTE